MSATTSSLRILHFEHNALLVETTANTLTATIVLLGLYQDEQERVYRVIKDVIGDRKPVSSAIRVFDQCIFSDVVLCVEHR